MPWVEANLRGQRVLARANPDGSLRAEGGRVEIRYGPNDGRMYRAAAGNLAVIDGSKVMAEDACGPAAPVNKAARAVNFAPATVAAADGWIAFTDGACSGNPGPAGCGVVLVSPDGKTHEGLEYLGQATNNVAELTAILRALEWIPKSARSIVVHTDSQYAIGVLQKGWKAKANQDLVSRTRDVVKARHALLVYVPGHQGVALNERADALAREAVEQRVSRQARSE
jgi:ribonuclease HI